MNTKKAIAQLKIIEKSGKEMRLAAEEWQSDFQILVSTILSARTRDEVTIPVAEKLFKKYPTAKKLAKAKLKDVQLAIKSVNFYKNKSKNIISCAKMIVSEYNSRIPHELEKLVELPGVGRKVANVYLVQAHKAAAIGVDTHLSQTSRKLRWSNNKNPYKIEKDLEKLFPRRYWNKLNYIVVRFGRTYSKKEKDKILNKIKKNK